MKIKVVEEENKILVIKKPARKQFIWCGFYFLKNQIKDK